MRHKAVLATRPGDSAEEDACRCDAHADSGMQVHIRCCCCSWFMALAHSLSDGFLAWRALRLSGKSVKARPTASDVAGHKMKCRPKLNIENN